MNTRELIGSPIHQSIRERRARGVRLASGLIASTPAVKVFDEIDNTDVTNSAGVLTGSAGISDGVFTTPLIQVPQPGRVYRVECWFMAGGEQWIRYFRLIAEE